MFEDSTEDLERSKGIIAMLIKLANVDDEAVAIERRFIMDVADQLGLAKADLLEVAKNPDDFELQPPEGEQERMNILYYLLFTMRVDGVIKEEEERLCHKAGLRLGFNENLTTDLIGIMKKYMKEDVPPKVMLDAIRTYLN